MSSLTLSVNEKQHLVTYYTASVFDDSRNPRVTVTFELAPDLGEQEAFAAVEKLISGYGLTWLKRTPEGWLVDGAALRESYQKERWLPSWVAGRYTVGPRVSTHTRRRDGRDYRVAEFTFEISEHLAAMSGVTSVGAKGNAKMHIQLVVNQPFKSIVPNAESTSLSEFTVLTGLNGSGKTHVLQGIAEGYLQLLANGQAIDPKRLIDHSALTPTGIEAANTAQEAEEVKHFLGMFQRYRLQAAANPGYLVANVLEPRLQTIAQRIAADARKELRLLSDDDIIQNWPINTSNPQNVLAYYLSSSFRRYYDRHRENRFSKFQNQQEGEDVDWLTDEEFVARYGPAPWDLINRFLEESDLTIRIDPPRKQLAGVPYQIGLTNIASGAQIFFSDLSSGEKIFLSIGAAIYNAGTNDLFPRVLLLDEPDSHLHPLMARKLLDAILKVFVKEHGLVVLMATHSPTTVALAPEESVYSVSSAEPRISKVSKDKALSQLTAGVPSLSVHHENRRQVFVESKYDAYFYERLYLKLKAKLVSEISLNFIASDIGGSGSSGAVKEVVKRLSAGGNKSVFGIIDWDLSNDENGPVKVFGKGSRYSIENYIFDPLLIAVLLLRERMVERADLGLDENARHSDFAGYEEATLQTIVDRVTNDVAGTIGGEMETTPTICTYVGGKSISIPIWYLRYQGHDLEDALKKTYGKLQRFHKEGDLKKAVIDLVIEDLPEFIPQDVLDLLKSLQALP